jgi:hypothetical protein
MSRVISLCLLLCISSLALASSVEVVYVVSGTTILTYNVDRQTLNYTQVGTLSINGASTFGTLVPSPNDHFTYVTAADANQITHLYVYATDANGAPNRLPRKSSMQTTLKVCKLIPRPTFFMPSMRRPLTREIKWLRPSTAF